MDLKEQFEKSVAESKELSQRPDNQTLLQLYSLYKQATEGDINTEPPSNPFDIVAKAKHKAWESLKGKTREEAMGEYVVIVKELKA